MVDIVVQREAARTNSPPIGRGLSESHPVRPLIRFRSKTHDGMVSTGDPKARHNSARSIGSKVVEKEYSIAGCVCGLSASSSPC